MFLDSVRNLMDKVVCMPYLCRIYAVFLPYDCIRRQYGIDTAYHWPVFGLNDNSQRSLILIIVDYSNL
ncbi:MAG: hypothetical protein Q8908_08620, partial [Bacteroidota bacterium]|nr:hypothetical protein [Bacteroidota bacterium]